MYLAGWNHYPEGQIRNALYLHQIEGTDQMPLNGPVTEYVQVATEDNVRQVCSTTYGPVMQLEK